MVKSEQTLVETRYDRSEGADWLLWNKGQFRSAGCKVRGQILVSYLFPFYMPVCPWAKYIVTEEYVFESLEGGA